MPTTIACPHCQGGFPITETAPGTVYECPLCGGRFKLGGGEAPPVARVAAAPEAPPVARTKKKPGINLSRTCPACGERYPTDQGRCPACGAGFNEAKIVKREAAEEAARGAGFGYEKAAINMGVVGGLLLIGVAAAWFILGYLAGRIFYYPPILAAIGVFAILKGMFTGNMAGGRSRSRGPRGRSAPARRSTRRRR